jgi:hypothetical protein
MKRSFENVLIEGFREILCFFGIFNNFNFNISKILLFRTKSENNSYEVRSRHTVLISFRKERGQDSKGRRLIFSSPALHEIHERR